MDDEVWSDWSDELYMSDNVPTDCLRDLPKPKDDMMERKDTPSQDELAVETEDSKQRNKTVIQDKNSMGIVQEPSKIVPVLQTATDDSIEIIQEQSESVTSQQKATEIQEKDRTEINQKKSQNVTVPETAEEIIASETAAEIMSNMNLFTKPVDSVTEVPYDNGVEKDSLTNNNTLIDSFKHHINDHVNSNSSNTVSNIREMTHHTAEHITTVSEKHDLIQNDVENDQDISSFPSVQEANENAKQSDGKISISEDKPETFVKCSDTTSSTGDHDQPDHSYGTEKIKGFSKDDNVSGSIDMMQVHADQLPTIQYAESIQENNTDNNVLESTNIKDCCDDGLLEADRVTCCNEDICSNAAFEGKDEEEDLNSSSEELVSLAELKRKLIDRKSLKPHQAVSTQEEQAQKSAEFDESVKGIFAESENLQLNEQTRIEKYINIYLQEPDITYTNTDWGNEDSYFASPDIGDVTVIVETMETDDNCDPTYNPEKLANETNFVSDIDLPVNAGQRKNDDSISEVSEYDGYNSDTPLAFIQKRKFNENKSYYNVQRKTNSDSDSEFTPSKFSPSSSATSDDYEEFQGHNDHEYGTKKKRVGKRKINIRDTNWKRRGKRIRQKNIKTRRQNMKKTNEMFENKAENTDISKPKEAAETATNVSNQNNGQNMSHHNGVEKAIQLSLKEQKLQNILHKYHTTRLDKLLASNMMERYTIPADGNCLLAAVLHQLGESMSTQELRTQVAEHLEENIIHYLCFVNFTEAMTPEQEQEVFVTRAVIRQHSSPGKAFVQS